MRFPRRVSKWMLVVQACVGLLAMLIGLATTSMFAVLAGFGTVLAAYFVDDMQGWP